MHWMKKFIDFSNGVLAISLLIKPLLYRENYDVSFIGKLEVVAIFPLSIHYH